MSDFLMAIWADRDTCKPYTGPGRIGHVVRVSSDARMTVINEFTDGGSFEHEDCGPASLQSWFLDKTTVRTTIAEIEELAGTNLNGTGFTGLINAAAHFGYEVKFSPDNPAPGFVMNPGGGFIDPPSTFASYLAATQGGCLVLPNVAVPPAPPVPPTPPPQEDPDMIAFVVKPGDPTLLIPGLTGNSNINLVALKDTQVAVFMWDPNGKPIASATLTLEGNVDKPGVGPVQIARFVRQLFPAPGNAFTGPCTLSVSAGTEEFTVVLH